MIHRHRAARKLVSHHLTHATDLGALGHRGRIQHQAGSVAQPEGYVEARQRQPLDQPDYVT